jgi:hypothetical protein
LSMRTIRTIRKIAPIPVILRILRILRRRFQMMKSCQCPSLNWDAKAAQARYKGQFPY